MLLLSQLSLAVPDMVLVEGGEFTMGNTFGTTYSSSDKLNCSALPHKVKLTAFYMGKYEVTEKEMLEYWKAKSTTGSNTDFQQFVKTEKIPACKDRIAYNGAKIAAAHMCWYDAVDYCNWLSKKNGLPTCYRFKRNDPNNTNVHDLRKSWITCDFSAGGYRLPTEAEWEYAARGGKLSQGYKYSGSNIPEEVVAVSSGEKVFLIGQKKPNELGIYDMSGNLNEWCWDWAWDEYSPDSSNQYYSSPDTDNPKGLPKGDSRVVRNGIIVSKRDMMKPFYDSNAFYGFRVVRTAK